MPLIDSKLRKRPDHRLSEVRRGHSFTAWEIVVFYVLEHLINFSFVNFIYRDNFLIVLDAEDVFYVDFGLVSNVLVN